MTCDNCAALQEQLRIAQADSANARDALSMLYQETADYIKINNLGDVHHNQSMKLARNVLATPGPGAKLLAAFEALKREHGTVQRFFETDGSLQMAMEIEHDAAEKNLRDMEGDHA